MPEFVSRLIAAWPMVAKRSLAHWRLLSTVVIGVLLASAIMSGTVIYFDALRELALKNTLAQLTVSEKDILVKSDRGPTTYFEYQKIRDAMEVQFESRFDWLLSGTERGGKTSTFFLASPGNEISAGGDNSRGYFAFLPSLDDHIQMVEGVRPRSDPLADDTAPLVLEVLVPAEAARNYGVGIGDRLAVVPYWQDAIPYAHVEISGLFERNEPTGRFWHLSDRLFSAATGTSFDTVPFYVTEDTFMNVLGASFKDMDSSYGYLLEVDPERLNADNSTVTRLLVERMERKLAADLFSFRQITELDSALAEYDQRLFFSKLPMFIILVLIAVVILYYVVTLSSLLVEQQRGEIALLRSRGASSAQILAVFVLEGGTITAIAIVAAPLLASAVISLLGFTPAFSGLSGADRLTVNITSGAYMMSALGGLLSFAALMVPAVQASRIGVTRHRQESARPSAQPFFQRYYLDVMLLVVSLLLFRQLSEQGSVVATNLFGGVAVNQVLLAVPALILVAFAMVLLRLFPLAIQFLSGDSDGLLHMVVGGSLVVLLPTIAVRESFAGEGASWLLQIALLAGMGGVYWLSTRNTHLGARIGAAVAEAGLVAGAVLLGPDLPLGQIFVPLLIAVPPAGIVFLLLKAFSHRAPVGFSMGLWQMARNPTHYARLSLLLILMTGLGIFAASFGGTLNLSFRERALYATGTDIRLDGVLLNSRGPTVSVVDAYEAMPSVESVGPVIRSFGTDLSKLLGKSYTMFSMDGEVLAEIAEFRPDFSPEPMRDMVKALKPAELPQGIPLPEDARSIGARVRADRPHPSTVFDARLRDSNGRYFTYSLGQLDRSTWTVLNSGLERVSRFRGRSPLRPKHPMTLVSLSVVELDGRNTLRAGSVAIDEIRVTTTSGESHVLEAFDDVSDWNLLRVTPSAATDDLQASGVGPDGESGVALFIWSQGSPLTSRGIYHGPPMAPLPVIASDSFLKGTGHSNGEAFEVSVSGHRVPVQIVDSIDFFPTLDTYNDRYLLSDGASLMTYVNLDASSSELRPNEIWLSTNGDPVARQQLLEELRNNHPFSSRNVHDREGVLAASQVDPLVDAGWRALLFMAFAAVLILSCLGFLVHAYVSFKERENQFGLMRTIGFSLRQLTTLVWMEQALVIGAGMALGTWMGGRLGAIVMPFLSHNDRGGQVLPPFVLQVNWATLAITYGVMVAVFAVIILGVLWFIRRISLQRILRLGEM